MVRVCAVCAHVLETRHHADGGVSWFHIKAVIRGYEDHVAVPVLPTEVRTQGECDFCSAPSPQWEVPADDFMVPGLPGHGSQGAWACCGECAQVIERMNWVELHQRTRRTHIRRHGSMPADVDRMVRKLHKALRANITGPVRPLVWPPQREE